MLWRIRAAIHRFLYPWLSVSVRRELLDSVLESVHHHMNGRVLEIGAGRSGRRGRFCPPVETSKLWCFVDLSIQREPHIQADTAKLPFPQDTFDTVLCLEVFEYLDDPLQAMKEIRRVLQPGGRLLLSVPFLHRWDHEHDLWRPTDPGLRSLLEKAGFKLESLENQGGPMAVIVNIVRHLFAKHQKNRRWLLLCLLFYPLLKKMLVMDREFTTRSVTFKTFTTGFFVIARA